MEEDKRENVEAKQGEFTNDEVNEKDAQPEIETSVLDLAFEQPSRKPFTTLSQEDSDLALARALQEQVFVKFYFPSLFHTYYVITY